jgi:hypothetical protein
MQQTDSAHGPSILRPIFGCPMLVRFWRSADELGDHGVYSHLT